MINCTLATYSGVQLIIDWGHGGGAEAGGVIEWHYADAAT
jgi:hypothetical protein